MPFSVDEIKGQLLYGGARPTLFHVDVINPINSTGDGKFRFMCESATLPPSTLGTVPFKYFGRTVKFAGDREFPEWSTQVVNDEDFLVRNALESWSHAINHREANIRSVQAILPAQYKSSANVVQYSKSGAPIRVYKFIGLWPKEVGTIEVNWDSSDQMEKFQVTWEYDYWEIGELTEFLAPLS